MIYQFKYKREAKQNPYIGFVSFQHFRNDELYSDLIVKPENNMTETEHVECYPVPDYVEEKGRAQGYYPDSSVVYIRILWKEFEPIEGEYNYAFIEDILRKARENGQTVMFRLMQHSTRESDDVPDWLKTKIECPARPAGMRVKDCPKDPKFLDYFGRAIRALGERFDGDPTLAFMDISLPGSWGEGSSYELFSETDLKRLIDAYTKNFKNTKLIGQIIAPHLIAYGKNTKPVGWRADGVGHPIVTDKLIPEINKTLSNAWETAPISFEAYWWLGEWQRKGWDIKHFFERMLECHASTFNAKSLPIPYEYKQLVDDFNSKIGYHFGVKSVEFADSVNKTLAINLNMFNYGVAPIYDRIPLKIRLKGERTAYTFVQDTDITKWMPSDNFLELNISLVGLPKGKYDIEIGIFNQQYTLELCMDTPCDGKFYLLGRTEII